MSGRDRISALPDEILCEILSLLPIKVACTTTILSKRWFSLYYSLTTLHFEDEEEEGRPSKKDEVDDVQPSTKACLQFRRFVDTFMLSKNHHPIKTFHLTCHSKLWGEDIAPLKADEWVEAAKRRGVEDFHIHIQNLLIPPGRHSYDIFFSYIFHGGPRTLNHSMSAIQVAKAIMVKRFGTVRNLKLPPGIFTCKTLVVLKLGGLIVGPDVCSVDLPSLKTLHLTEVYFRARKDLMMLLAGCLVLENLHAPTLNPLQRDCISEFTNLPKLQKADIRVLYVPLTILYNVKILRIDWVELHVENLIKRHRPLFMQIPNHNYYTAIPLFQNLIHIEICCHAYGEVLRFLQHCPNLQILVTEKCFGGSEWYDDKPYPDSAPKCISLHLRTCSIVNYEGKNYSSDFQFGSYVLKNATHLQVMTIYNPTYQDTEQKRQDLEKLHSWCPSAKISLTSCSTRLD